MSGSLPAPSPEDIAEVRETLKHSTELEHSENQLPGIDKGEHVPGLKLLTGIMKAV